MSDAERATRAFYLAVLGSNRALQTIVVSLCRLYRYRDRVYRVVPRSLAARASIVVVDADDPQALEAWAALRSARPDKPGVLIGARFPEQVEALGDGTWRVRRTRLSAHLLRTLDAVTVRWLKYVPELVIDDGGDPEGGLGALLGDALPPNGDARGRVLVVDDSLAVRTQMEACLRLHELEVDMADDAEGGLDLAGRNPYDVIFLDVMLPEMDGYKACKLLKSRPESRDIPVVMLTGKSSTFNKVRGVMAGCDRYLTKPVQADELRAVLEEYIPALVSS